MRYNEETEKRRLDCLSQLNFFPTVSLALSSDVLENSAQAESQPETVHSKYKSLPPEFQYDEQYLKMSSNRKGDLLETFVTMKCWMKGCEVFNNAGCDGKADTVIFYKNSLARIDIKAGGLNLRKQKPFWEQRGGKLHEGIYGVCVIPAKTGFTVRWYNHKRGTILTPVCPAGWEDLFCDSLQ